MKKASNSVLLARALKSAKKLYSEHF